MIKKLIIIPAIIILSTSIHATNFCETNIVKNIVKKTDPKEVKNTKVFKLKQVTLAQKRILRHTRGLDDKAYNEEAFLKLVENLKNNKKYLRSFLKNRAALNKLVDSIMWLESNEAKNAAIFMSKKIFEVKTTQKTLFEKNYKNLLALKNINYFNSEKEEKQYIRDIWNSNHKDDIYKSWYENIYKGNLTIEDPNKKELLKKEIERTLKFCMNEKIVELKKSRFDLSTAINLFNLSKLFPEKSNELRNLYNSISYNTNIWEVMETKFHQYRKNVKEEAMEMENLLTLEGNAEYLKDRATISYNKAAVVALKQENYPLAWDYSAKSLEVLRGMSVITFENEKTYTSSKRVIMESSKKLLKKNVDNYEPDNANFIYNKTLKLTKGVYRNNI